MRITKPTLLVNETIARNNIMRMAYKAHRSKVTLRPHFKTHQSAQVAEWFREVGIESATVSSVDMARYFADAGWKDLTIAFPYNPLEAEEVEKIAKRINLNVLIVSKAALDHLHHHVNAELGYFIKIDVGTHRTGLSPDQTNELKAIAESVNAKHQLKGLLAHAGHSYKQLNQNGAQEIFDESMVAFSKVKAAIGRDDLMISYGDTPTCSILENFSGVDEIRPGNFVFYDVMQQSFGSCDMSDVAVCMACPVVSIHPERNEAVIYGGAVHFSKDFVMEGDRRHFGKVVRFTREGWRSEPIAEVNRLSQEHGILRGSSEFIKSLQIGSLVGILPVHSCLTADLQGYYVSLKGEKLTKLNRAV